MQNILITRDSKGKCRVIYISCIYDDENKRYIIKRSSGLYNGKLTEQPELIITKGKVKRTLKEQAELEYNSLIRKQLDKGYKNYTDDINDPIKVENFLPKTKSDQNGNLKPMLCKVLDRNDLNTTNKT